ncbi:MAG: hypothetical protein A2W35_22170 [Chloroflexi bacterium RBG_16_57_11]|nr:MAG: hypothetical protein A2W35_22170 [Chloroflexi bacterium RBG_16_57_11]
MKLSNLLIFNTIVALPFGLGFLLAPGAMANLYDVSTDPAANLIAQFFGVSLIAIGLLTWFARNVADSKAQKAIIQALLIADVLGLIVAVMGMVSGVLNTLGWLTVVLYLLLVLGYGYFLFMKPGKS